MVRGRSRVEFRNGQHFVHDRREDAQCTLYRLNEWQRLDRNLPAQSCASLGNPRLLSPDCVVHEGQGMGVPSVRVLELLYCTRPLRYIPEGDEDTVQLWIVKKILRERLQMAPRSIRALKPVRSP